MSGLQEQVARATIFLPPYDQRLSSDTVVSLHDAIGKARRRVCPKPAFVFKTRKSAPAPLAVLIAEVRREVGTTSDQDHLQVTFPSQGCTCCACEKHAVPCALTLLLDGGAGAQGDTTAENLDPTLCFVDREGETLVKATGEVKGRDFVLARLKNCTVFIADTCGAVRADRLDNCRVFIGPTRSLLVEKADDTTLAVAAQQVRIHSATRCDFFVHMRSGPIIEHSSSLRFAPYHFSYPELAVQLREFGLGEDNGLWRKVEDFNWLRARQSPNWCILEEEDRPPPVAAPGECAAVSTGADVDAGDGDEM